jgi:hypothetical protein
MINKNLRILRKKYKNVYNKLKTKEISQSITKKPFKNFSKPEQT